MLVAVQLSVLGSYSPPVFNSWKPLSSKYPPHTIISLPVHTAVCSARAAGALVTLVAIQLFVPGWYSPPVFKKMRVFGTSKYPPQTIISPPVHTAVWLSRPSGALVVVVAVQLSAPGLYLPPVLRKPGKFPPPPQTIISLPVQTAV